VRAWWSAAVAGAGESIGEVSQQRPDRRVGHMVQDRAIEPGSQAAERSRRVLNELLQLVEYVATPGQVRVQRISLAGFSCLPGTPDRRAGLA
jgi:hypothetical protein